MANKNYINGIFANKVGSYDMINLDITEAALEALTNLPKNAKGVRKITLGAQKSDPNKYSVWENSYKKEDNGGLPW